MRSSSAVSVHRAVIAAALTVVFAGACANTPSTTVLAEENARLARRAVEEPWLQKDFANIKTMYASDCLTFTNGQRDTLDTETSIKQTMAEYPDYQVAVEDVFATPDRATVTWTFSATDPKSKKPFKMYGTSVLRMANNTIIESRDYYDVLGPMLAAGATFAPPAAAPAAPANKK